MEVILLCLHMLYFIGNLQRWLLRPWQTYFLETRLDLKKKRKKKERKIEISAKTQYTLLLFFGPPNFRKRGNSLEHFTTQMLQSTHFKLFKNIGYIAQLHY